MSSAKQWLFWKPHPVRLCWYLSDQKWATRPSPAARASGQLNVFKQDLSPFSYLFFVAVTNYHEFIGLKHEFITVSGSLMQISLSNSQGVPAVFLPEAPEESVSLAFSILRRHPPSWLLAHASIPRAAGPPASRLHTEVLCDHVGPALVIRDHFPILTFC